MSKDKRSAKAYINDIKWAIDDIMSFVSGLSYEEFCKDKKTIYAVIRCLEIIGKASKHVPEEVRAYRTATNISHETLLLFQYYEVVPHCWTGCGHILYPLSRCTFQSI